MYDGLVVNEAVEQGVGRQTCIQSARADWMHTHETAASSSSAGVVVRLESRPCFLVRLPCRGGSLERHCGSTPRRRTANSSASTFSHLTMTMTMPVLLFTPQALNWQVQSIQKCAKHEILQSRSEEVPYTILLLIFYIFYIFYILSLFNSHPHRSCYADGC